MKKFLYSFILASLFFIPYKVFALEGQINLNCVPASVFAGDAVNCTIAADVTDGSVTDFSGTVQTSENMEFVSSTNADGWTGTNKGGLFTLTTKESKSNSFEIASFTVKMKSDSTTNGTITLKTTKLGEVKDVDDISVNINLSTTTNVTDTGTNNTEEDTNTDIKNPDTGSNIPFMIIGCGSLGAIIIYEIASTRKKIHKI